MTTGEALDFARPILQENYPNHKIESFETLFKEGKKYLIFTLIK